MLTAAAAGGALVVSAMTTAAAAQSAPARVAIADTLPQWATARERGGSHKPPRSRRPELAWPAAVLLAAGLVIIRRDA